MKSEEKHENPAEDEQANIADWLLIVFFFNKKFNKWFKPIISPNHYSFMAVVYGTCPLVFSEA